MTSQLSLVLYLTNQAVKQTHRVRFDARVLSAFMSFDCFQRYFINEVVNRFACRSILLAVHNPALAAELVPRLYVFLGELKCFCELLCTFSLIGIQTSNGFAEQESGCGVYCQVEKEPLKLDFSIHRHELDHVVDMFLENPKVVVTVSEKLWPQERSRMLPRRTILGKYAVAYQRCDNITAHLVAKICNSISHSVQLLRA